jgi:hypothetical protein
VRVRVELAEALRQEPINLRARMLERLFIGENVADVDMAQALISKYPHACVAGVAGASGGARNSSRKQAIGRGAGEGSLTRLPR